MKKGRAEFEGKIGSAERQAEGNIKGADSEMKENFQVKW